MKDDVVRGGIEHVTVTGLFFRQCCDIAIEQDTDSYYVCTVMLFKTWINSLYLLLLVQCTNNYFKELIELLY